MFTVMDYLSKFQLLQDGFHDVGKGSCTKSCLEGKSKRIVICFGGGMSLCQSKRVSNDRLQKSKWSILRYILESCTSHFGFS